MTDWLAEPTEDGYWWLRHDKNDQNPEVVLVTFRGCGNSSVTFCGSNDPGWADTEEGEWLGPITPQEI